jgi:hypothetical protein
MQKTRVPNGINIIRFRMHLRVRSHRPGAWPRVRPRETDC